jgi:signal transduction histidine kinase
MSATAATAHLGKRARDRGPVLLMEAAIVIADLMILIVGLSRGSVPFDQAGASLLAWTALVAISQVVPLSASTNLSWSLDLPLLLGAGLVFGPITAGLMGVIGTVDPREFRGEITLGRACFNRAQVSLSAMSGVAAFELLGVGLQNWPWTAVAGLVAVAADMFVNYALVASFWALKDEVKVTEVVARMSFGPPGSFIPLYACFGFLGVLVAEAFGEIGFPGVLAFAAPLLLAQQAFRHRQVAEEATQALESTVQALRSVGDTIATERRDERLVIAGELHDEVLPPLFQVHLMGQVIKQDLGTGRLLDLDQDVPDLLVAAEAAQTAIRDVILALRQSTLGPGGLKQTVRAHAAKLEEAGSCQLILNVHDVGGSASEQLLAYQVAREAMNNAARHSRANTIEVSLAEEDQMLLVTVDDDGVGFDQRSVDEASHFGLQLITERVRAAGGSVIVDSRLGKGTHVHAAIPTTT